MSNIDKQVLRQLAGKATKGEWVVFAKPTPTYFDAIHSLAALLNGTVGDQKTLYMIDANGLCPALTGTGPNSANNAEFIAAANPATVLALLDELEAAEERYDDMLRQARSFREAHDSASEIIRKLERNKPVVNLPTTKLWAGKVACYEASEIIELLSSAGIRIQGED